MIRVSSIEKPRKAPLCRIDGPGMSTYRLNANYRVLTGGTGVGELVERESVIHKPPKQ